MKPLPLLIATAMAGSLLSLAPDSALGQPRAGSVLISRPTIDLGEVTPDAPESAAVARVDLVLQSSIPWHLSLVQESRPGAELGSPAAAVEVLARPAAQSWAKLIPALPSAMASGAPTGDRGVVLAFEVAVRTTMEVPAGPKQLKLALLLNGQPVDAEVTLSFLVPKVVRLASDPRPFSTAISNPTQAGVYGTDSHHFRVTSNVPWRMKVRLASPLRVDGSTRTLSRSAMRVLNDAGAVRAVLVPDVPFTTASGPATGREGRTVELRLAIATSGAEPAGEYASDLEIMAEPAPPVATALFR